MNVIGSPERSAAYVDPERRLTLHHISWATYVHFSDGVGPGVRITYDRGRMEIVTLSAEHERIKVTLRRVVEAYADTIGVDAEGRGSMTVRRADLARGLEPDECYYVARAAVMIGRARDAELDLTVDPPPDLAIEVDLSPPEVDKPPIYAALGVPEVWRHDGRSMTYSVRTPGGDYELADRSLSFPDLPVAWVNDALAIGLARGQRAATADIRRRVAERAGT